MKTPARDEKYPVLNRDNLTVQIPMQFSQKQKTFSQFFASFLKSRLNFKCFQSKLIVIAFAFRKLRTLKMLLHKCLKSPVSDDRTTSNMVNRAKDI